MKETQAIVQSIKRLSTKFQQVNFASDQELGSMYPGQALLARAKRMRLENRWHPYLRDVWYPTHVYQGHLTVDLPMTYSWQIGDVVDLVGPIGQPFKFKRSVKHVLLIAYNMPPNPLLMFIPTLLGNQIDVTLALLGNSNQYPSQYLPADVKVIYSEDKYHPLAWRDQVITVGYADQVIAVVPSGNRYAGFYDLWQLFTRLRATMNNYLYGMFHDVAPCGVGACHLCMFYTHRGDQLACQDGTVFDLADFFSQIHDP